MAKKLTLKQQYDKIAEQYIKLFCEKQDLEFDYWIGDDIGGGAMFTSGDYFVYSDIIYDIENNCEKGLIIKWQEDYIENYETKGVINYHSYAIGLRYSHLTC